MCAAPTAAGDGRGNARLIGLQLTGIVCVWGGGGLLRHSESLTFMRFAGKRGVSGCRKGGAA